MSDSDPAKDSSAPEPEGHSPSIEDEGTALEASPDDDLDLEFGNQGGNHSTVDLNFLSPSDDDSALGRIGDYEVLRVEGCGGMGVVLKAYEKSLNRMVAIKIPTPHLSSSKRFRRRFQREARSVAAISHPNVVTIHAVGEHQGMPFLVMEYITGRNLQQRIRSRRPMDVVDLLRIGSQMADGLEAAHRQGVIHRDIKPSNIMLENGIERVKITDFGLARAAMDQSGITSVGRVVGTPAYMSPEQLSGTPADARSDLFALGCVLYSMAIGHSPFQGSHTMDIIRKVNDLTPPPLHELNTRMPPALSKIVAKLLEKNPEDRYQSAAEVGTALANLLSGLQQSASGTTLAADSETHRRAAKPRSHKGLLVGLGLLLAAGLASIPFWPAPDGEHNVLRRWVAGVDRSEPPARRASKGAGDSAGLPPQAPEAANTAESKPTAPDLRTADQKAAEWVLGIGGTLEISVNGESQQVAPGDSLPNEDFQVLVVTLKGNHRVTDAGLESLRGLAYVHRLDLFDTPVSNQSLAIIGTLSTLTELDLYKTRITDAGLTHIGQLTQLVTLSIHYTKVTDAGLPNLANLTELVALNLKNTDVSDEGLQHLAGLTRLRWLQLSGTRVTDSGLESLKGMSELKELYLSGTQVTDDGISSLKTVLPECVITR